MRLARFHAMKSSNFHNNFKKDIMDVILKLFFFMVSCFEKDYDTQY